jgi:hypothetical protein
MGSMAKRSLLGGRRRRDASGGDWVCRRVGGVDPASVRLFQDAFGDGSFKFLEGEKGMERSKYR